MLSVTYSSLLSQALNLSQSIAAVLLKDPNLLSDGFLQLVLQVLRVWHLQRHARHRLLQNAQVFNLLLQLPVDQKKKNKVKTSQQK